MRNAEVFLVSLLLCTCAAIAQDCDQPLNAADKAVRNGDFVAGLAQAQQVISGCPGKFEGYYYAAYALYKQGLFPDALSQARRALELVTQAGAPDVQKLIDAINSVASVSSSVTDAERDEAGGMTARAAQEYFDAWKIDKKRDDLGLKAADLWLRLRDFPAAARVLYELRDHPHDGTLVEAVKRRLAASEARFNSEYARIWNSLSSITQSNEYLEGVEACRDLRPNTQEPYLRLGSYYAAHNNAEAAKAALSAANRIASLNSDEIVKDTSYLDTLLQTPDFIDFLRNMLGSGAASTAEAKARRYAQAISSAMSETDLRRRIDGLQEITREYGSTDQLRTLIASERAHLQRNELQQAQNDLPEISRKLERLLPGNFKQRQGSGDDSFTEKQNRKDVKVQNCILTFHQDETVGFAARLDYRIAIAGLKAQAGSSHTVKIEATSITGQGQEATNIGVFFQQSGYKPVSRHDQSATLFMDAANVDEVIRLLNEASLACTTSAHQ